MRPVQNIAFTALEHTEQYPCLFAISQKGKLNKYLNTFQTLILEEHGNIQTENIGTLSHQV